MKKVLFVFLCIVVSAEVDAQLSGSGTYASPYSGIFENDLQWNFTSFSTGRVYINGDVTIDDEQLTIQEGMKIIFLAEGADLIVTSNGRLTAVGNPADSIIFTADDDDDGNFGESGERWGHIVFHLMNATAGISKIEFCTIKWGDVSGESNTTNFGGGVYVSSYSDVSISHCTISRNKAAHGGGIMTYKDGSRPAASPFIIGCNISYNTVTYNGGGLYLFRGAPTIRNCLIHNNIASSSGGGIYLNYTGSSTIVNSTIVSNSALSPGSGSNIQYINITSLTDRPKFLNCITWGNDNSINYLGTGCTNQPSDFNFCAIRDVSTPAASFTSCIDLANTNDATGPNFVNPGTDWSLKFISPCRDAGTDTYTGFTVPSVDLAWQNRVYTTDIGAYEVQYSYWTGGTSTEWSTSSNWSGSVDPFSGTGDVIIPSGLTNYPVSPTNPAFTIGTGKFMTLEPGARLTLGSLTNNGTLTLESDATGISSLISSSYSGNNANIQLYLTGGAGTYGPNWHYISSPFTSLGTASFTGTTQDLARWVESQASADLSEGWIAYDGYVYRVDTDPPYSGLAFAFNNLDPGTGYNHYFASNHLYTLQGQINTANTIVTLGCTDPAQRLRYGLNLLGNPFSSGLDWDLISGDPLYPLATSKAIYFNKGGGVVYYNRGVGSEAGVTGTIPPMQGFFTKTYASGNLLTIPASARTHVDMPQVRYKGTGSKGEIIPLVRMNVTSGSYQDNCVVRFANDAKTALDLDFDAEKLFLSASKPYIYTVSEGTRFAINGQPFPVPTVEIPLVVNVPSTGTHKISATQVQGLDNYPVMLIDNVAGSITDLKHYPNYSFTSPAGLISERFVLKVGTIATGKEDPVARPGIFNIYPAYGNINIQTLAPEWDGRNGTIRILDLTGKVLSTSARVSFSMNSIVTLPADLTKGIYVVEITGGPRRHVGKIVIR